MTSGFGVDFYVARVGSWVNVEQFVSLCSKNTDDLKV